MTDITPKREREAWRGTPLTARPWADVVRYWDDWTPKRPKLEPLSQFIHSLAASPAASALFVDVIWGGIVISDSSDFRSTDGVLEISYFVESGHFEFRHRTFSGHDDHKIVLAAEAVETLRLFLRYKYGILLEGPVA